MTSKRPHRPTFKEVTRRLKAQPSPQPYSVVLTESAKAVYLELAEQSARAEASDDPGNQHCTTFRMVEDAVHRLIPADPTNGKYALHEPLSDVYRIAKGRLRIAWTVSVEHRQVLILFISNSPRKDGDARDPYVILNAMARAGYLTKIMEDWRRALHVPPNAPVN